MGIAPSQPETTASGTSVAPLALEPALVDRLWRESNAQACGLTPSELRQTLASIGAERNFGQPESAGATAQQQAAFFRGLQLADLVLARACAAGSEPAWQRFLALYRQPLTRAAIAIAQNETVGRDLADQLYAELYGLTTRDQARRCPLESYQGRGSLLGWLRATVAQRFIDHHRRSRREEPWPESSQDGVSFEPAAAAPPPEAEIANLAPLAQAVADALEAQPPEERFLLASYYLDGRTLLEIAPLLRVHEATVSRRLRRLAAALRQAVLRNLERAGLSKRAAQEALGADPRDLEINLKKLLQTSPSHTFPEKAGR